MPEMLTLSPPDSSTVGVSQVLRFCQLTFFEIYTDVSQTMCLMLSLITVSVFEGSRLFNAQGLRLPGRS